MIRFACVYCGVKVGAKDAQACRLTRCPACGHRLRVPRGNVPEEPSAQDVPGEPSQPDGNRWAGMSDKQVAKALLKKRPTPEKLERLASRRALAPLLPHYDNLTLFALSVAFLLLAVTGSLTLDIPPALTVDSSVAETFAALADKLLGLFAFLIPLAVVGMLMSLFGVFVRGKKAEPLKFAMLCFAILATGGTGVYAGIVILGTDLPWPLMIFPLWNIVQGFGLLFLFRMGLMHPECIVDRRPSGLQVIITVISLSLLLALCRYALDLHWTITYSVCVCYTMSLNHTLQDFFGSRFEHLTTVEQAPSSENS